MSGAGGGVASTGASCGDDEACVVGGTGDLELGRGRRLVVPLSGPCSMRVAARPQPTRDPQAPTFETRTTKLICDGPTLPVMRQQPVVAKVRMLGWNPVFPYPSGPGVRVIGPVPS